MAGSRQRAEPARQPVAGAGGPVAGPGASGPGAAEAVAVLATLAWLVVAGLQYADLPPAGAAGEGAGLLRAALLFVLPVGLIWTAAIALRALRVARDETRRLQAAVDALRQSHIAERQARGSGVPSPPRPPSSGPGPGPDADPQAAGTVAPGPAPEPQETSGAPDPHTSSRTPDPRASSRDTDPRASSRDTDPRASSRDADPAFSTSRERAQAAAQPAPPREEQPRLALEPQAQDDRPPLANADLIRALNFPDSEGDAAGFAALRRALRDRRARQLVQASQDVLTLLSQDGIYMDDLHPDRARPEIWRRFAQGERGRAVAALGGIRDRSSLALTGARMREDTIFRDAAHHFLRLFDKTLVAFEPEASDEELVALSDTRTARAFMLFGRVTGTFD